MYGSVEKNVGKNVHRSSELRRGGGSFMPKKNQVISDALVNSESRACTNQNHTYEMNKEFVKTTRIFVFCLFIILWLLLV